MSTLQHETSGLVASQAIPEVADLDQPSNVVRVIKPSRGWIAIDWHEIYQSRELFETLVMRDIKVRYKQTVLGVGWAVLQPLASVFIFTIVFSNFQNVKPDAIPYPLFLMAAMIPWTFFMNSVGIAGSSLLAQQALMSKIYFPRIYVPASSVGTYLIDMAIGLGLFAFMMPYYHYAPSINLIFLPVVIFLTFLAAFGLGLVFASLLVLYRDLRFVMPFVLSMMMYASPIFYQQSILSERVQFFVSLNPVTGLISAYRWCILGLPLDWKSLSLSVVATVAILIFGLFFFRRTERYIADLI